MIFSFNKDPFLHRRTSESWEPWAGPGGNKIGERLPCRTVVAWIEPGIKERENRFTVSKGAGAWQAPSSSNCIKGNSTNGMGRQELASC